MSLEEIINLGATLIYDPNTSTMTPDEFLSAYGETVDTIGIVAKSDDGSTYFVSNNAPNHPRYGDLFSSFAQIATDIGIQVYGIMHGNVDQYFSNNPNFAMYQSNGTKVDNFVCPNQENYSLYIAEIAAEIANRIPVSGIIIQDILYPRDNTCFCENCKRTFSQEVNIDRDFTYEYLVKRPEIFSKWQKSRIGAIRRTLSSIVNRVHQERKLDILAEVLLDPGTNYFKGAIEHFGQDLTTLTQVTSHLLLHFYPWSSFPETEQEIDQLLNNMQPLMNRMSTTKNSLFIWGPSYPQALLAHRLKQGLHSDKIFFTEQQPRNYLERRTLHLQLGI